MYSFAKGKDVIVTDEKGFVEVIGLFGNGQKMLRDGVYHLIVLKKITSSVEVYASLGMP